VKLFHVFVGAYFDYSRSYQLLFAILVMGYVENSWILGMVYARVSEI